MVATYNFGLVYTRTLDDLFEENKPYSFLYNKLVGSNQTRQFWNTCTRSKDC